MGGGFAFISLAAVFQSIPGGTLVGVSVMRVAYIGEKGMDIFDALARELDICQYVLQRKIKTVMAMENGNVVNAIAATEAGVVCTVDISATLPAGEQPKDKHEIIAQRGTACDVVVDAQLKQDSIYVFGAENQKFTDVDFELYGLSLPQIHIVRAAFALAQNGGEGQKALGDSICALKAAAKRSAENGEREVV